MTEVTHLACRCGTVHLELRAEPIISTECHCNSCREASRRLAALPGSGQVAEDNGGTRFVLYRKDRAQVTEGAENLREFRLTDKSTTRRIVAGCCNTPVFLEFKGGHWLSLYANLWPKGTQPPLELRTVTGDRSEGRPLDGAVPSGAWPTTKFYARLLGAWIAMGFKAPDIAVPGGRIDG
jgi:hypothetical protein